MRKIDRTKNRSDRYQHLLIESPCAPDALLEIVDSDLINFEANPHLREELLDLKEQLLEEFWRVVNTKLTERQCQVITLYCEKKTQTEIAKILNVNQSSITKSINGNCDYKNGKKVYGGAKKKIQKIVETDEVIQELLKKIQEIYDFWA